MRCNGGVIKHPRAPHVISTARPSYCVRMYRSYLNRPEDVGRDILTSPSLLLNAQMQHRLEPINQSNVPVPMRNLLSILALNLISERPFL